MCLVSAIRTPHRITIGLPGESLRAIFNRVRSRAAITTPHFLGFSWPLLNHYPKAKRLSLGHAYPIKKGIYDNQLFDKKKKILRPQNIYGRIKGRKNFSFYCPYLSSKLSPSQSQSNPASSLSR